MGDSRDTSQTWAPPPLAQAPQERLETRPSVPSLQCPQRPSALPSITKGNMFQQLPPNKDAGNTEKGVLFQHHKAPSGMSVIKATSPLKGSSGHRGVLGGKVPFLGSTAGSQEEGQNQSQSQTTPNHPTYTP